MLLATERVRITVLLLKSLQWNLPYLDGLVLGSASNSDMPVSQNNIHS